MAITAQPRSILQLLWWRKPCVFFLFARSKHGCLHQHTPPSAWLSLHPSCSGYRVPGKRRGTTTKCLTSVSDLALPSPLGYDTLHLGVYVRWFPGSACRVAPSRQDPARQLQGRGGVDWVQLGSTTHAVPVPSPSGKEVFPRQQVKHRRNGLETTAEPALTAPGETAAILLLFWLNFVVCGVIVGKRKQPRARLSPEQIYAPPRLSKERLLPFRGCFLLQHLLSGNGSPASLPVSRPHCRLPRARDGEGASPNLSRRHRRRRLSQSPDCSNRSILPNQTGLSLPLPISVVFPDKSSSTAEHVARFAASLASCDICLLSGQAVVCAPMRQEACPISAGVFGRAEISI